MRIGIDARFFGPQERGLGRYVDRLLAHLSDIDHRNDYVIFMRREAFTTWNPPNERWHKVLADYPWYSFTEQWNMPRLYRQAKLDLLHVPHFNVPLLNGLPYVVTIHDLILHRFPTPRATTLSRIYFWFKYLVYLISTYLIAYRARKIITVSEYSHQDIVKFFHISPEKVSVTYESVDPLPPPVNQSVIQAKGVHQPYLLHVGNSYPHKNLERLLSAVDLAHRHGEKFQIVLVGKKDFFAQRLAKEYSHISNVLWYGFAADEELSALYQSAQGYFFPSMSEGFGLPGLEAMAAGCPVYAARASCLPEIFGSAAHYFDPVNVEDIVGSIQAALHDTLERRQLIERGRKQCAAYSWERMARQTLDIYQNIHAQNQHHARPAT